MSSLLLVLLLSLLLSVSLHACTARSLSVAKIDAAKGSFDKDYFGKVKLLESMETLNICESCSKAASGTSIQADLPSFLVVKDERKHVRSMLGHNVEETAITNGSDTAEDVVEMDYAQPHRKPPIHNEKP